MIRRSHVRALGLVLVVIAVVAAACSSSSKKSSSGGSSSSSSTVAAAQVKQGGDITLSAEQEPDCMDWIGSCAGAAWGVYTVQVNTMPDAYHWTSNNTFDPTDVLTGPADLVSSPNQVVTYHINPKAVWSDGQPITSTDFKYTWDQIAGPNAKDIYDPTGYSQIASVDDSDPHTAVVTFKTPFPDWKMLWGGNYGILPSHILQGQDRDAMMKDGYKFSGGPWMLDHWTKGVEVKLVPNPMYWGKKPNLSSVTFKFITDTATEQQDYRSGQVLAIYPQAQPGQEALKSAPGTYFNAISGLSFEALWFNNSKAPLNDKAVRQALAYATDRNAIVKQLFGPVQPDIQPIQSFATPAFGDFYTTSFSKYSVDLNQVNSLMTGDGWTKGSDGIWAKNGQKATIELKTTTGNKRRLLTAQILQSEWQAAGFQLSLTPEKAGVLFGQDGPSGNFQVALFAQTPTDNDPSGSSSCNLWCTANIPGPSNGNAGTNWYRVSDPTIDGAFSKVDTSLDNAARKPLVQQGEDQLAALAASLPLDPFPDIIVINTDKLAVEGGTFQHNFATGPFTYLNMWYLK
jgi:peptide/nickel transport system substrate-binding protein